MQTPSWALLWPRCFFLWDTCTSAFTSPTIPTPAAQQTFHNCLDQGAAFLLLHGQPARVSRQSLRHGCGGKIIARCPRSWAKIALGSLCPPKLCACVFASRQVHKCLHITNHPNPCSSANFSQVLLIVAWATTQGFAIDPSLPCAKFGSFLTQSHRAALIGEGIVRVIALPAAQSSPQCSWGKG